MQYQVEEMIGNQSFKHPVIFNTDDEAAEYIEDQITKDILETECRPAGIESLSELDPDTREELRLLQQLLCYSN